MESVSSTAPAMELMNGPLVTWVRTFESDGGAGLTFGALTDGVFLYDVLTHIDPPEGGGVGTINRHPDAPEARLSNLARVLQHILRFSQEVTGQQLLLPLPDLVRVSHRPNSAAGVQELRQLLLLVLGCAVQSHHKETVVENIKKLDVNTQHAIVECIQEITDNPRSVWPPEWTCLESVPEEQLKDVYAMLMEHCRRLANERDQFCLDWLRAACGEGVIGVTEEDPNGEGDTSLGSSSSHLAVQLADHKAQLRRLRQEHDEKCEQTTELKEELEQTKTTLTRLRQEAVELSQDARSARAWRDESDMLRERAARVDTLEAELARCKDKLQDIHFYKTRVEELREDNKMLTETKDMLEQQLETSRKRAEQVLELENKILQLKQTINQMSSERDSDRDRLQELLEENALLEMSARNSLNESTTLVAQLDRLKCSAPTGTSVSSDLNSDAQTRLLKLQLENQRLEGELESLKLDSMNQCSEKILELEKENKRLSHKVLQQQENECEERRCLLTAQEDSAEQRRELQRLQETLQTVRDNADRQCREMQEEATHLHELIESLRARQQQGTDARLTDVESENRRLSDNNIELQSQVSRMAYEKQQLQRMTERLRDSADRLMEVENQKAEMERENKQIQQSLTLFREASERHEKLERDHASLEVEFERVSRKLENSLQSLSKLEGVQGEKLQLQVEVERLTRKLESVKQSGLKMADLEGEREALSLQTEQLQQQITALQLETSRVQQLELDLMTAGNEAQKLKRSIETCQRKMKDVEKEKVELESENLKLQRTVDTLKLSTKKLNELERDLTELEGNNDRLERENKSLNKEVLRLKESLEVKDSLVEESSSKAASLQRCNQRLSRQLDSLTSADNKLREVCQEKRQLEQHVQRERKTLAALREDLVSEKVRTQQLCNQLDSLQADLVKLGLNPANLSAPAAEDGGTDRYHALEAMLHETLKSSLEVRDEKIASLESRLTESVARNSQLRQQLLQVRTDYESLLQRHQEEAGEDGLGGDTSRDLVSLKTALARTNEEKSSLEADMSSLTSQASSYREQVCALQSQVTALADQNTVMSKHNAKLQGDNARLQVENTTLQSQSASLIAQNTALQSSTSQHEEEREKAMHQSDERWSRLQQVSSDHATLRRLHEQLQRDYDSIERDHTALKQQHKMVKHECRLLQDQRSSLEANEDQLVKMRETLEDEMSNLKSDSVSLSNLRAEHSKLKDDFRSLFSSNEKLRVEYKSLQHDYKAVKTEHNTLKLRTTELGGELNETKDQMATLDVEVAKLTNKCQVLQDANVTLEEARRSLIGQVSQLLSQYHDLLTQTLDDKHHYHQEEKTFADKLNNLQRQKEKLEEKIMEQYRRMDNTSKNKRGFGSNLVRRVRKAGTDLISKTGRSRSRGRDDGVESPDSSSLGSSSHAHESSSLDSGSETRRSSPTLATTSTGIDNAAGKSPCEESTRVNTPKRRESLGNGTLNGSSSATLHRKSMPPSMMELGLTSSLRGSVSSEEVASVLRSCDTSDPVREEDVSLTSTYTASGPTSISSFSSTSHNHPSTNGHHSINSANNYINIHHHGHQQQSNGGTPNHFIHNSSIASTPPTSGLSSSLELGRAGSRRPLCVTEEQDGRDREPGSRPVSRSSSQYSAVGNVSVTVTCNGTPHSVVNAPTHASTPKSSHTPQLSRDWQDTEISSNGSPGTPRLPPRLTPGSSGPQIPPRNHRDVATPTSLDLITCHLDHSTSQQQSPPNRPPAPPPKPSSRQPPTDRDDVVSITSAGGSKERRVANSVWYEYGCV